MNRYLLTIGFAFAFAIPTASLARHRYSSANDAQLLAVCPIRGDAKNLSVRALNKLKRRMSVPSPAYVDKSVTLGAMVALGDDTNRFDSGKAAIVDGYVADVKVGGVESVNCHTHDPKYRDTHIEITLDPLHDDESKHVIIEVTPQWRELMATRGIDWSTSALRKLLLGHWIRVTGWLLFDKEHASASENTAAVGNQVWRATAWEIHPITSLQVLPGKPG